MTDNDEISHNTRLFRTSSDPAWARLRELVRERGVSPETSWLAVTFEDDVDLEFGILVTANRHAFQYDFRYPHRSPADGTFTEWLDVTGRIDSLPHRQEVSYALSLVDQVA